MVGVGEISAFLASLKSAKDIAQAMVDLRDEAAFQAKAIEFQSTILDAQGAAFASEENRAALVNRVRDLEQQVTRMEAWESEKQRYGLKQLGQGTLAYAVKKACAARRTHNKPRPWFGPGSAFPAGVPTSWSAGNSLCISNAGVRSQPRTTHRRHAASTRVIFNLRHYRKFRSASIRASRWMGGEESHETWLR